jgi:hypothetical protein
MSQQTPMFNATSAARPPRRGPWLIAGIAVTVVIACVGAIGFYPPLRELVGLGGNQPTNSPGTTLAGKAPTPAASAAAATDSAPTPTPDGTHPLWALTPPTIGTEPASSLPKGTPPGRLVPYLLNPADGGAATKKPTLFTSGGQVRFEDPKASSAYIFGVRRQGVFVATEEAAKTDQEGALTVRLYWITGTTRHELFHRSLVGQESDVTVSPDGTTVAVNLTADLNASQHSEVALVETATGKVTKRLPGTFDAITWASNDTLLVYSGGSPSAWRAPWTGTKPSRTDLAFGGMVVTVGGLVGLTTDHGCLARIDPTLKVLAASCGGWTLAGDPSPDGTYLPVSWRPEGDASQPPIIGFLDTVANRVISIPISDQAVDTTINWVAGAEAELTFTQPGQTKGLSVSCVLSVGECRRVGG